MEFTFDPDFNERLYEARHAGFETVLEAISSGQVISDYARAGGNDSTERALVVALGDKAYYVPYIVVGERWLLQTVYPASQLKVGSEIADPAAHQTGYLNEEEKDIIDSVRSSQPSTPSKPDLSILSEMRKNAAKLLKRQRKGRIRISPDGPPDTKEHFGEIAGRLGKIGRW